MRILSLFVLCGLLLAVTPAAQAGTGRYWTERKPYHVEIFAKLGRGLTNAALSPFEIPTQSYKEGLRASIHGDTVADMGVGAFAGLFTGIGYGFMRLGIGIFDTVTFPIPTKALLRPATPAIYLEDLPSSVSGGATLNDSRR